MHVYEVLQRPVVTEKSNGLAKAGQYTFEVARKANKRQVKEAVERIFSVTVVDVKTINVKGKRRRWGRTVYTSASWKKAIVTLAEGDSITFFEGA